MECIWGGVRKFTKSFVQKFIFPCCQSRQGVSFNDINVKQVDSLVSIWRLEKEESKIKGSIISQAKKSNMADFIDHAMQTFFFSFAWHGKSWVDDYMR